MNVNPVNTNYINFQSKHKHENKTGGAGKAWCSTFIPGLGQFLDGRNEEGAVFLGGTVAINLINGLTEKDYFKSILHGEEKQVIKKTTKLIKPSILVRGITLGFVGTALWLMNIVDAYKGNRHKSECAECGHGHKPKHKCEDEDGHKHKADAVKEDNENNSIQRNEAKSDKIKSEKTEEKAESKEA